VNGNGKREKTVLVVNCEDAAVSAVRCTSGGEC
jgi:hypothetical protein